MKPIISKFDNKWVMKDGIVLGDVKLEGVKAKIILPMQSDDPSLIVSRSDDYDLFNGMDEEFVYKKRMVMKILGNPSFNGYSTMLDVINTDYCKYYVHLEQSGSLRVSTSMPMNYVPVYYGIDYHDRIKEEFVMDFVGKSHDRIFLLKKYIIDNNEYAIGLYSKYFRVFKTICD